MENEIKAIEVQKISKTYGNSVALNNVSFSVKKGTIHGFIGPNGAGKSTTLGILMRLIFPDSGEAYVEGKSVKNDPYFNQNLGFVPADVKFPDFTVKKYVSVCSYLRDIPEEVAMEKLSNSPLNQYQEKKCAELSTGWKKFLQIFALGLYKPRILILDEPFNGLDPTFRTIFFEELIKAKEEGRTVLLSTHILSDLQELADNITMIKLGNIIYTGPKSANIQKTYEEYFIRQEKAEKQFSL